MIYLYIWHLINLFIFLPFILNVIYCFLITRLTGLQFAGYNDEILEVQYLGGAESHLVVATNSALIKVFEIKSWAVQILRGHTDTVLAIDIYQDRHMFASSSKVCSVEPHYKDNY